ncbi:MAG: YebC/PmpR family DNA-binding transcriptional regulator [Desulfobulbaceae bacterium]|nr:YebC/PmpR family DNA-binding transcriptional regulator [Desulfobulbaceae bacterium]
MSGHSKWANIKHKKGAADAKRGKVFTKLIKEITVAARMGGGDPAANPRLRTAIATAKSVNMPKDNVERGIKKGTGELEGVNYEEILYEGYGPGGVAVLVECMTDNRNRTVADIRMIFSKANGNLGESGCVAYMFDRKGSILFDKDVVDEEKLMDIALEAGADDVVDDGSVFQVLTEPLEFDAVREALEAEGLAFIEANLAMIPQNVIDIPDEKTATQLMRLLDSLEDCDDVQNVHANFDISDEIMEAIS